MSDDSKERALYLRKRFEMFGAQSLMPRDAVELILGYALSGEKLKSAVDTLFEKYHGIKGILSDSPQNLMSAADLPEDAVILLMLMSQFGKLLCSERAADSVITDVSSACEYFRDVYRGVRVEQFKIACLNADDIAFSLLDMGSGSTFGVDFTAENVVAGVARAGCARCILAHNHPGGSCEPSPEDIRTTDLLCRELEKIGVTVIDHIIVGRDGVKSLFSGLVC